MAKNKKSKKRNRPTREPTFSAVGIASEEPQEERPAPFGERDGSGRDSGSAGNGGNGDQTGPGSPDDQGGGRSSVSAAAGGGFLAIYKIGQGYFTRLGTAIGGGLVLVFGAHFIYGRLSGLDPAVQLGVPSLFLAVAGLMLFWVTGSNRKTNDFFIATEGEMKKVSWSTQKEVVGSTKVVLAFTFVMTVFLFVVDMFFMFVFSSIDVLQMDFKTMLGFGQ